MQIFPPYWLEPIPCCFVFPLYWLELISCRIDWNRCTTILVGTVLCKIFPAVLVEINFAPYWLEPIPCCCFFPLYLLEPISHRKHWNQLPAIFVYPFFCQNYTCLLPSACVWVIKNSSVIFSHDSK